MKPEAPCIVVPTYEPTGRHVGNIERLTRLAPTIVVDNGSERNLDTLDVLAKIPGVQLVRQEANCGISSALNVGIRTALDREFDSVFTFDQDSNPQINHIAVLIPLLVDPRVGLVGPAGIAGSYQRTFKKHAGGVLPVSVLIQSGMGFTSATYSKLGGFDESLFIDGVDTEYCLRARQHGLQILAHRDVDMPHSLGAGDRSRTVSLLGRTMVATGHAPWRRYFVNRNLIHLLRQYGRAEPRWAGGAIARTASFDVAALLFESERRKKMAAAVAGIADGLRGERGVGRSERYRDRSSLMTDLAGRPPTTGSVT